MLRDINVYGKVSLWKFRVVMSDSSMMRPWTLFCVGLEDAVLPMPALRKNRSGDSMREPNILLLELTVAGSGDGLEVETWLGLHYCRV